MQVWLFFQSGTGGDGIANLFERSTSVEPIDRIKDPWRIHRIVDGAVKFYAPNIDELGCFRRGQSFDQQTNRLVAHYIHIVKQDLDCVVTSHDVSLDLLLSSDCCDILTKNQIKVLLTSNNPEIDLIKSKTKNLVPVIQPRLDTTTFCPEKFNYVLDVDLIKTDWNYVESFCKDIGFKLDREQHLQYQDLLKGNKTFMSTNFGIEEWTSAITDNRVEYKLVNIWQP